MTTYVIRKKYFDSRFDEDERLVGFTLVDDFKDQHTAEIAWKSLEVEALKTFILNEKNESWYSDCKKPLLNQLDELVFEYSQQHILTGNQITENLPDYLQDDEIFEFIQKLDIYSYEICEFQEDVQFYAIWLNYKNRWMLVSRGNKPYLVYDTSREQLFRSVKDIQIDLSDYVERAQLEDMAISKAALMEVFNRFSSMEYYPAYPVVRISYDDQQLIEVLDAVLKQPIFAVRTLSLAQVLWIEKKCADIGLKKQKLWQEQNASFAYQGE